MEIALLSLKAGMVFDTCKLSVLPPDTPPSEKLDLGSTELVQCSWSGALLVLIMTLMAIVLSLEFCIAT